MAYVPGCPTFPAVLGDWLATGYNFFAGVWPVAEGPNAVELAVLEWFRQWTGMPAGSGGLLTNGGSGATLTAIIAARHAAVGDDASRLPRLAMYASDQVHSAALRAAWIAGVPRSQRPRAAERRGLSAAHGGRGAGDRGGPRRGIDSARGRRERRDDEHRRGRPARRDRGPLRQGARVAARGCRVRRVRGATERGARLLTGLGRCDSVALDPHKWLFVPFECGSLLVREPERLRAAFQVLPDYLRDVAAGQDGVNFADYGEQLTRQSRALKVWLGVRYFGFAAPFARRSIARSTWRRMRRSWCERSRCSRCCRRRSWACCASGPACRRGRTGGARRLQRAGECRDDRRREVSDLIHATAQARSRMRLCILGFRTTADDVAGLIREVVDCAGAVRAERSSA